MFTSPCWLQPLVTFVGALVVGAMAYLALHQRDRADRKQEWWKRTQWAVDKTLAAGDRERHVGFVVLQHLQRSHLTDTEDQEILSIVADQGHGLPPNALLDDDVEADGRGDA